MFWQFWKNNRNSDAIATTDHSELSNVLSNTSVSKHANLDLRRAILDWRDQHIENIEFHLSRELMSLFSKLDDITTRMTVIELCTQNKFGKNHLEPVYKKWVESEVAYLVNEAQKDLSAVFSHVMVFTEQGDSLNCKESNGHYTDATIATVATGAGLAAIPYVASVSAVSAGGIMGILGVTTIAWPIVAFSAAVISGLLAIGGHRAVRLKQRAILRYQSAIRAAINEQVLGIGNGKETICLRLQAHIEKTAKNILQEID